MKRLAEVIQRRIDEEGSSVLAAEKRGGLSRGVIWNILNGRTTTPRGETLQGIAKGLGCTVEDIYAEIAGTKPGETSASSSSISSGSDLWNGDLYEQCVKRINALFASRTANPTKEVVLDLVDEIYNYSLQYGELDERMAEILVRRELRNLGSL